jgi:hypothetical protein
MAETFPEITVTKFTAGPSDQDSEKPGLFRFQFLLSRAAPELWVRIASMARRRRATTHLHPAVRLGLPQPDRRALHPGGGAANQG